MLKVYIIRSDTAQFPLAEIRTDGKIISWVVDNTKGMLPKSVGKDFAKLNALIARSSRMSMSEPNEATAHLLTYVLDNGETVQITTDNKTAILNGRILQEDEKAMLFNAIRTGQIKIARKANLATPTPILPASKLEHKPEPTQAKITPEHLKEAAEFFKDKAIKKRQSSKSYDHEIENYSYLGDEDPEFTKKMLYALKYGDDDAK